MGTATVQPAASSTRTNARSNVHITVRDVQMSGPSVAAIRNACNEVVSGDATSTRQSGPAAPKTRRTLTPQGRKRISQAQKARHAAAQRRQEQSAGAGETTGNNPTGPIPATQLKGRKAPATAKTATAGS